MTDTLSTSSKPPQSEVRSSHKLSKKNPCETITLTEESHEVCNSDTNEFPSKSPRSLPITIPYLNCQDGVFVKNGFETSTKYLTMKSLGRKLEGQIFEKQKKNRDEVHSPTAIDENSLIIEEKEDSEKAEEKARKPSRMLGPEQLKILELQIKEKEILRKDVLEIKKKRTRMSLYLFRSESTFRRKQIVIAESK